MQDSALSKAVAIAAFFGALTFVVVMTFTNHDDMTADPFPTASIAR